MPVTVVPAIHSIALARRPHVNLHGTLHHVSQNTLNEAARQFTKRYPLMEDGDRRRRKGRKIAKVLDQALNGKPVDILLDVGCSNAIVLDTVCAALTPQFAVGIDMDMAALPRPAAKRAAIFGDALALPIASGTVDVVICNHMYEHVPNANALFSEIHRALKPGGLVYFGSMNARWPVEPHYRLPFLHWLPHRVTRPIMRWFGHGEAGYIEKPLGYGGLRQLVSRFSCEDYTLRIIAAPALFCAEDVLPYPRLARILSHIARAMYGFLPGYVWILRKP